MFSGLRRQGHGEGQSLEWTDPNSQGVCPALLYICTYIYVLVPHLYVAWKTTRLLESTYAHSPLSCRPPILTRSARQDVGA